jgi:hypothetical protein
VDRKPRLTPSFATFRTGIAGLPEYMTQPVDPERPRFIEYLLSAERPVVEKEVAARDYTGKARTVCTLCTVISTVCWVFALVLLLHALLVVAGAGTGTGFASFIASWAGGIGLGVDTLFTPADERMAVLLNVGVAALAWLAIGALLTFLISHVALPADERRAWYRRSARP